MFLLLSCVICYLSQKPSLSARKFYSSLWLIAVAFYFSVVARVQVRRVRCLLLQKSRNDVWLKQLGVLRSADSFMSYQLRAEVCLSTKQTRKQPRADRVQGSGFRLRAPLP